MSAPRGSSRSSSRLRSCTTVRSRAARWRIPPDSWNGYDRSKPASPNISSKGATRVLVLHTAHPRHLEAERHVVDDAPPWEEQVFFRAHKRALGTRRRHPVDEHLTLAQALLPP